MKPVFIIKYTLFEAYKRKFWLIYIFLLLGAVVAGLFVASVSITETLAGYHVFYAGLLRAGAILLLAVYIILTENRVLEEQAGPLILVHAINRSEYGLGKWIAYTIVALLVCLLAMIPLLFSINIQTAVCWAFAFVCELQVAMGVSLLLVLVCRQAVSAMTLFTGFYLFARISTELSVQVDGILSEESLSLAGLMAWLVKAAIYLVPALDQYAYTARLIYPADSQVSLLYLSGETLIYSLLLLLLSLQRLQSREF